MNTEIAITGLGISFALLAIYQVRRASRDAVHKVEPDPERVQRFVETAPLKLLNAFGHRGQAASERSERN